VVKERTAFYTVWGGDANRAILEKGGRAAGGGSRV
jgi:hypothetical protein